MRCGKDDAAKTEALKFAVHFVGDIHQPLHTVGDAIGGNAIAVDVFMRGHEIVQRQMRSASTCRAISTKPGTVTLINKMVWDWGAYVDRLEDGWLKSADAKREAADRAPIGHATFVKWAEETHKDAIVVWNERPADNVLTDDYLNKVVPVLDRQLGRAGLRLARFLNQAYASRRCPVH